MALPPDIFGGQAAQQQRIELPCRHDGNPRETPDAIAFEMQVATT
jgi:hypothetical protein